jgi:hypothetical protein
MSSQSALKALPLAVLDKSMKLIIFELVFSTVLLFIRYNICFLHAAGKSLRVPFRTVYRTIELTDGGCGTIFRTQRYFNILDGAMIVIAHISLNILLLSIDRPASHQLTAA